MFGRTWRCGSGGAGKERISRKEGLLAKHSQGLLQPRNNTTPCPQQGLAIALTGSTSSLGSYLLDCLVANTQMKKVICLNRGADGETKQKNSNKLRGLTTEWGERVHFLSTDSSKIESGFGTAEYNMLVEGTSAIIRMRPSLSLLQATSRLVTKVNQWYQSKSRFLRTAPRWHPRRHQSLKPVTKSPLDLIHLENFHRRQLGCETPQC